MNTRPPSRDRIPHRLCQGLIAITILLHLVVPAAAADGASLNADLYGRLLEKHTRAVSDIVGTHVDYRALGASSDWKRLVRQVHSSKPSLLAPSQATAFWINAYNILTIDLIIDHYPIDGIKEIGSFFSPVWDREVATIEGRVLSLGAIEHEILRKLGEPRIHSAIVCASVSCPPLARTPFRGASLDADLSAAMRSWLSNDRKGVFIDRKNRSITVSKIFDWFAEDFDNGGGVLANIVPYLAKGDAAWIRSEGKTASLRYFDYDWSLND